MSEEQGKHPPADIPPDIVGQERTLLQMFKLFVEPEIERRKSTGTLPDPFFLTKAQVLFFEGSSPVVRINDEVRISLLAIAPRAIQKGEPIDPSEIKRIKATELDLADSDAGHFTALLWNGDWLMSFDFRPNKGKASSLVKRAEEFCAVAEHANSQEHFGPAIDNLFSACELAAKARLITSAAVRSDVKTHGTIHAGINRWGKLGNVDGDFVEVFNRLADVRTSARYTGADLAGFVDADMLAKVRAELEELKARLKRFTNEP